MIGGFASCASMRESDLAVVRFFFATDCREVDVTLSVERGVVERRMLAEAFATASRFCTALSRMSV
jgi:hypothetical protein